EGRWVEGGSDVGRHGEAGGHVEAADDRRDAGVPERPGDVEGAGKLVRLHAYQANHAEAAVPAQRRDHVLDLHAPVGLVDWRDVDRDIGAEDLASARVEGEHVDHGKRIRWDGRTQPLNDIAVIVVVGRLYQNKLKTPSSL